MVTKPASKKTPSKNPVSTKTAAKPQNVKDVSSENLQRIIDQQGLQIQKMEKMIKSLDAEVKALRKQVQVEEGGKPASGAASKPKATVKSAKIPTKAASATSDAKKSAAARKPVKTSAASAKKPAAKAGSKSVLEDIIEIPQDIADRINALTQQKKVTQTQLGKETDLSQKKIHEIAARKVKDLNKDIIARLTAVIKKYEAK